MANLSRTWRWERFAPDLGNNLELQEKEQLSLRIASGLSAERMARFRAEREAGFPGLKDEEVPAAMAKLFDGIAELEGAHTVEGKPVATLADYLGVVLSMQGAYNVRELVSAVEDFNSIQGTQRLFSQRFSGGLLTTRAQSAAKAGSPTGAR